MPNMRRRFFVEGFQGSRSVIEGAAAHHLGHVLRAKAGQVYELSDGERVWLGRIENVARDRVEFALIEEVPAEPPAVFITLLISIVKFDAFEWAIEKATELGASMIVPLAAARSEKALLKSAAKRAERWAKILLEASQQSRRLKIPKLLPVLKAEVAFRAREEALRLLLSERPKAAPLRRILPGAYSKRAVFAVGPEGGWTDEEIESAGKAGFVEVSLGKQILRTETAVAAGLAAINYALGED